VLVGIEKIKQEAYEMLISDMRAAKLLTSDYFSELDFPQTSHAAHIQEMSRKQNMNRDTIILYF